jgi:hypothetical protein
MTYGVPDPMFKSQINPHLTQEFLQQSQHQIKMQQQVNGLFEQNNFQEKPIEPAKKSSVPLPAKTSAEGKVKPIFRVEQVVRAKAN